MNLDSLMRFRIAPLEQSYTWRDTALYALSIGYGANPVAPSDLAFVYEQGLKAVPSQCVVLAHPGFWAKDPALGIAWVKMLHGEHGYEIHQPLPPQGSVRGEYEIEAVDDKGPEKGAVLYQLKKLYDVATGDLVATVRSVLFLRGDGGCGSVGVAPPAPTEIPEGRPDAVHETATLPQQALIYRLNGDVNPIHVDPAAAEKAGFDRPILHGLCTMGLATRALLETFAPTAPERVTAMRVRFSKPVLPGETIVTEFFRQGDAIRFRCRVRERDVLVLDRGTAILAP